MDIKRVDHYSIRNPDLEASRASTPRDRPEGRPRPPFNFPAMAVQRRSAPRLAQRRPQLGFVHLMWLRSR